MMREIDPKVAIETLSRAKFVFQSIEFDYADSGDTAVRMDIEVLDALIQQWKEKLAKLEPGLRQH
jgi:hypothetical protein